MRFRWDDVDVIIADTDAEAFEAHFGVVVQPMHLCPDCGSTKHGQPRLPDRDLHVSVGRTAHAAAVALREAGPVGVDIESVERVHRSPIDAVVLTPEEHVELSLLKEADRRRRRTQIWVAKEAVLKSRGRGFIDDPAEVRIRFDARTDTSASADGTSNPGSDTTGHPSVGITAVSDGGERIQFFELSDDVLGAVAVLPDDD